MARNKIKDGNKPSKDQMRVHLKKSVSDQQSSTERKEIAQKILALMFASIHKRGRPTLNQEEKAYVI